MFVFMVRILKKYNLGVIFLKRKIAGLCAFLMMCSGAGSIVSAAVKGDVNCDGAVTAKDLNKLIKYIHKPVLWVIRHKFLRFFKKKKYSVYENKIVRDFRDGKVTKEELDRCSTCESCQVIK